MFFLSARRPENTPNRQEMTTLSANNDKMADEESLYECLSSKISGLRRNGTLKGRNMIRKVPCPIVPTGQPVINMNKMGPNGPVDPCPRASCRLSTISSTSSSSSSDTAAADLIESWLASIHFDEYVKNFVLNGYDLATASRMSPEDLIAIGITNPQHRKKIKMEINALNVPDGIPTTANNLYDWLYKLRLEEYYEVLCHQSYDSIEKVSSLTWEDFEEIGIQKLGHQKRLDLAIKKMNQEQKKSQTPACSNGAHLVNQSHYASTSTINYYPSSPASSSVSFPDLTRCPTNESFRPVVLVSSSQSTGVPSHSFASDGPFLSSLEHNQRFKQRPVAMIQAKSRPASTGPASSGFYSEYGSLCDKDPDSISNSEVSSVSSLSSVNSSRHNYSGMNDAPSIYATLKRSKKPPPPPKRTNSVISSNSTTNGSTCAPSQFTWQQSCKVVPQPMTTNTAFIQNNHCKSFLDAVQEAAFATCVKSLASQFSQISRVSDDDRTLTNNSKVSLISSDDKFGGSYEFPPPPSPLRQSVEDISSNSTASENPSLSVKSPISSSSSNESLPFANDNLGTIRQSASSHSQALMTHAYSDTGSTFANNLRDNSASAARQSVQNTTTVMDDIETMLANLSNQLDAMLEQEVGTN